MNVKNKSSVASVALGIVGIVFSLFLPVVSYACCVPGLVISLKHKKKAYRATTAGMVLNIVGLSIAFINSVFAVVVAIKEWNRDRK